MNQNATSTHRPDRLITVIGLIIVFTGFAIALQLALTLWDLFKDQNLITHLATQVEQHSHVNQTIENLAKPFTATIDPATGTVINAQDAEDAPPALNIAYFAAWILATLLLGLIGHLAAITLSTGAKLLESGRAKAPPATREDIKLAINELVQELQTSHRSRAQESGTPN